MASRVKFLSPEDLPVVEDAMANHAWIGADGGMNLLAENAADASVAIRNDLAGHMLADENARL